MIAALCSELVLRKLEFKDQEIQTIYFGGGTPSVLDTSEIEQLLQVVYTHYQVVKHPEITLEANPDDLTTEKLKQLHASDINRLSIGVQSFFEDDLKLMNRAHSSAQAHQSLKEATALFDNISIDLIYGMPNMTNQRWLQNIEKALSYGIPHISSYALTVEPKTALANFIKKGQLDPLDEELAQAHFFILKKRLEAEGFVGYELSNFGKPSYFSKNNTAYWLGKKYLGIGPSAHSYNGKNRSWNIANNPTYIKTIASGELPSEIEELSLVDRYNEYVMTGLRTIWGISLEKIKAEFGVKFYTYLLQQSKKHLTEGLIKQENEVLLITPKGNFLTDGIASDLFMITLD